MKNSRGPRPASYHVSAGHTETTKAAALILEDGGNAADAAIAALWAACVAEPCMSSLGGGGFAVVSEMGKEVQALDFFCQSPRHKHLDAEFFPIEVHFGSFIETFYIGAGSVACPGTVAGLFKMHEQWGSIPMRTLVQPAIDIAKNGVAIDWFQKYDFELLKNILLTSHKGREVFFSEGDHLKNEGEVLFFPEQADIIEVLSREGKELFYKGEIASLISDYSTQHMGHINKGDLEKYEVKLHAAKHFWYKDFEINAPSRPSFGADVIKECLNHFNLERNDEAFRQLHLHSLERGTRSGQTLLQKLKEQSAVLQKGTTHFSIVDGNKMAVSLTVSNGEGNGYFIPGTQIQLNNMLGELALLPNGPNTWVPGKRLNSLMTPIIVRNEQGEPEIVSGSGGAGRIPTALSLLLHYYLDLELSPEASMSAPRVHFQDDFLQIEPGFDFEGETHRHWNVWEKNSLYFGGAHSIFKIGDGMLALGDARRAGYAINLP